MNDKRLTTGADVLFNVIDKYRRGIGPDLWRTHNSRLDAFEIGPGLVAVIGAPPKSGKTALSMQIVSDTLIKNPELRAYIANCEMSPGALMSRLLARHSGIALSDLRFGRHNRGDDARLEHGLERVTRFADRLIFYTGPFALDCITDTFGRADAGGGLLVVDYIQRLRLNSKDSGDDRRIELENVMTALRSLADAGLGIIAISAVARQRGHSGSDYAGIGLASLRGSSELEYGADSVWLLHTGGPDKSDKGEGTPEPEGLVTFQCAANRHGDTADIPLTFDKSHMTFHTMDV
ncbi:MAG: Replicative DNA helicase [Candidatus Hydrogenedentes bacterium ADurb.Bin101]|nr:MAG: Replicative DNA helicase [Candidatus Hydrogenedentes bacterium ADurb.Bin101]